MEKVSKFLDHYLRPIMQEDWSYIIDNEDLLKKFQKMGKIPQDSILVTADCGFICGYIPSLFELS